MPTPANAMKAFLAALVLALALPLAMAADMTPATPASNSLASARTLIAQKKWPEAIAELRRVNETGTADWNNLMGYSLRKSGTPDLAAAERHYLEALRIDPKHRGALEYSGELYLMKGDLPKAEKQLAALDKVCFLPCEEYTDLKKAVQAFKANGNRYVATP
ncbi:lipopolysaccharide assembly protein LapB [uncultured Hydrogenophaga sp.]|uniref:tetratricopeptide repeat protein n=1 Tax=uncultured Hydrogenophaga sp. TaxID=199683 RepID=UPI00265E65B6|nr:tetratricopeptide repeat protein [uncultured Hydrogenophaga sp.]